MAYYTSGTPRRRSSNPQLQAALTRAANDALKPFECGIHDLTYKAVRAGCPACQAERDRETMQMALKKTAAQMEMLVTENTRLKVQVDIVAAIREAADILGDDDMEFFKVVLYQWRDHKALSLKTTHGIKRKGRSVRVANGFIVMPRQGEPYGHVCSSLGGLAIADYFDEATNTAGPAKAMEWLVRGLSVHLPGMT